MLTAYTKSGKRICLAYKYQRETLLFLRAKEEFVCPICGEPVSLKLGDQRIYHFAHQRDSFCQDLYERETNNHLEGKLQFYYWLIRKKIPAVLEYYDKGIQQRPDIMFTFKGKKFALEYQCSTLPEEIFRKRTKGYLDHNYYPLWILSASSLPSKNNEIVSLSNFHYFFLKSTAAGELFIPAYSPTEKSFSFYQSITPFSIKNAFFRQSIHSLDFLSPETLLDPNISPTHVPFHSWNKKIETFKLHSTLHPGNGLKNFLQELYLHNLNLFLLPPEIGLPVKHSVFIHTPPVIWQSYLLMDVLINKQPNDLITLSEIRGHLKKRFNRKQISVRNLPQLSLVNPLVPIFEYLNLLVKLGNLSPMEGEIFQLRRKITLPKSNREMEEARIQFLQKNRLI